MKKVLIVDDNDDNLYLLKSLLEEEGFTVTAAKNGQQALDMALIDPSDLIISDILMPVMDGYMLCRKCKEDERLRRIPFLFYTATYTEPKDEAFALSLGADRFILKPQEPEALIRILQETWDKQSTAEPMVPQPLGEEMEFFRNYNEVLFTKFEKKMLDLETANRKLKCLEEQYRLSFENMTDIVWTIDTDCIIRKMSPSVERMLGYQSQDFIGRSVSDLTKILAPESIERAMADINQVLQGHIIPAAVYSLIAKDGAVKVGEISGAPIRRNGDIVGMVSVTRDITERRQIEAALQESEEKYRLLFNNASEAILVIHAGVIAFANPEASRISGYPIDTLLLKPFTEFIHPEDREMVYAYYRKRIAGEELPANYAFRIETSDGSVKWVVVSVALVDWAGSKATLNFLHDITGQRLAEEALRESEGKYHSLFENLQDAALLTMPDGSILEANHAASQMFGRSLEELRAVGRNGVVDVTDPRLPPALEERARKGRAHGKITMLRADGKKFLADITSTIFIDRNGQLKTSMIIRDITERKKAEEALRESENRYRRVFHDHPAVKFIIDPDTGSIIEANAAAANYYGWSRDHLQKMKIQEISTLPPEEVREGIEKTRIMKRAHFESRHRRADGSIRDVEVFSGKIEVKGKALLHSIIHDITERKRAEADLRKSEARFRSYFELPLIGIAVTSPEKGWLEGNERLSSVIGYSWEELKEMTWSELTYPEDLDADVAQFQRILAGEIDSYMLDKRFIRKDGAVIWTSLAVGCVRKEDGAVDYFVVLLEDISDRKESVNRLRKSLGATVQAMAVTVETRDPYTAGHQRRVSDLARAIAMEMGLSNDQIDGIRMAAVIHDLGKLSVPAELLSMPRKLTEIEISLIKTHARSGYDILKNIEFPWPIARMVLEHHERMDGSGYPQGLTGDGILMESRILSVADVVEAMASHRPYRPALGIDVALEEIEKNRGIFYDDAVANACLRLFRERGHKFDET